MSELDILIDRIRKDLTCIPCAGTGKLCSSHTKSFQGNIIDRINSVSQCTSCLGTGINQRVSNSKWFSNPYDL